MPIDLCDSFRCVSSVVLFCYTYPIFSKSLQYCHAAMFSSTVSWRPSSCHAHLTISSMFQELLDAPQMTLMYITGKKRVRRRFGENGTVSLQFSVELNKECLASGIIVFMVTQSKVWWLSVPLIWTKTTYDQRLTKIANSSVSLR